MVTIGTSCASTYLLEPSARLTRSLPLLGSDIECYLYMAPQLFWGMFLRGANAILSIKHKPHGAMPWGIRNHLRPIDDSEVML